MPAQLAKKVMIEAFKQKMAPTMFLSSFFKTRPRWMFKAVTVDIDVKRNDEAIAVDVKRGTGGNLNVNKQFTTKEYEPPVYNEYTTLFEKELNDRNIGSPEYVQTDYVSDAIARITDDQIENQEKILRSIEKQAADVLLTGTVPLINNDTLDYKQKGTHNFTAGTSWSTASADAFADLQTAVDNNRKDGKIKSDIGIFGEGAWQDLLRNDDFQEQANFRRVNLMEINRPVINTDGAAFHGFITVGAYELQVWTYPQYYKVPENYSLPNEGTLVKYIPDDKVIVLGSTIDLRLVYAGIPRIVNKKEPRLAEIGLPGIPGNFAGDFHPFHYLDVEDKCVKAGVESAPLCIPTQIDGYTVIDTII
ncbi:major capsid protein [Candidatus Pacearchaeota archaeon]|nr:major capsid protein [Candidatus Pacearchaeota archaeon]